MIGTFKWSKYLRQFIVNYEKVTESEYTTIFLWKKGRPVECMWIRDRWLILLHVIIY